MEYTVSYDPESECVLGSIEGEITPDVILAYVQELARVTRSSRCDRVLHDYRKAVLRLSTLLIHKIPQLYQTAGLSFLCRRALLVSRDLEDYQFYETTATNQGQIIQVFTEIEEARAWLFQKDSPPGNG